MVSHPEYYPGAHNCQLGRTANHTHTQENSLYIVREWVLVISHAHFLKGTKR